MHKTKKSIQTYDKSEVKGSIIGRVFEVAQEILKLPDGRGRDYSQPCPINGCDSKDDGFWYSTKTELFHCRRCGAKLDIFGLVMAVEKVTFPEALMLVGDYAGCRMTNFVPKDDGFIPLDITRKWFNNFSPQETAEIVATVMMKGALVIGFDLWTKNYYEVYDVCLASDRLMALSFDDLCVLIKNSVGHPKPDITLQEAQEILKRMVIEVRNQPGKKYLRGEGSLTSEGRLQ